jgi:hypothetical protein
VLYARVVFEALHRQVLAVARVLEAAGGHLGDERDVRVDPDAPEVQPAVHPDDRELVEAKIGGSLGGSEPHDFEYRVLRPDGEARVVRWRAEIVLDEGASSCGCSAPSKK